MATKTTHILKQGASGQTVVEAVAAICTLLGIPNGAGTVRWAEIHTHPDDGYDYIGQVTKGWGGFTAEQINAVLTLDEATIELEVSEE